MAESLFSPRWYRVSGLTPRLASHVRVVRHWYRGHPWYALENTANGMHFRLNESAWRFVGLLDGQRTVESVWRLVNDQLGDEAPVQDEVIRVLGQLHEHDLLHTEITDDVVDMERRGTQRRRAQKLAGINPLSFRIGLIDPEPLLARLEPLAHLLFSRGAALLLAVLLIMAGVTAASEWSLLAAYAGSHASTPRFLLITWLAYPFLKSLHELGHGLAVKRWGGEVHQAGITLMVLTPVPYVDASAAAAFPNRVQRMIVSAAGILVELAVASLGLFLWLSASDSLLREFAFALMLIGGASTVLFNGNPLLRYDGYYILADALEIPNMASRANAYVGYLVGRHILGLQQIPSPAYTPDERPTLAIYAVASALYRVAIGVAVVAWVADYSGLLAFAVGASMLFSMVLRPTWRGLRLVADLLPHSDNAVRARAGAAAAVLCMVALVGVLPLPLSTHATGVVWLPEEARLRAGTDGFIDEVMLTDSQRVSAGSPVVVLRDPELAVERAKLDARIAGLELQRQDGLARDPVRARLAEEEIARVTAERNLVDERIAGLTIRAGADGKIVLFRPDDLVGRFVRRGDLIAHVLPPGEVMVRVAVRQEDATLVRDETYGVRARLAAHPGDPKPARLLREVPAGSQSLPSAALGDRGGGEFPVDPKDEDGVRTLHPTFQFDVALPDVPLVHAGARVWVRFDHGYEPLVPQLWRRVRQLFLKPIQA